MKLWKPKRPRDSEVMVPCAEPRHVGNRMFILAEGYCDAEGTPFRSYICGECVQTFYPFEVIE